DGLPVLPHARGGVAGGEHPERGDVLRVPRGGAAAAAAGPAREVAVRARRVRGGRVDRVAAGAQAAGLRAELPARRARQRGGELLLVPRGDREPGGGAAGGAAEHGVVPGLPPGPDAAPGAAAHGDGPARGG